MTKIIEQGFTLVEIMITVALIGIISTIAFVSYSGYILKARRTEAVQTLLSMQLAEEQYRSENATYGTIAQVWNNVTTTENGFYNLAISGNTATAYTLTATAVGNQANDAQDGTSCTALSLAVNNNTITKTPLVCWAN